MRAHVAAIHGIGDFVPGDTSGFLATLGPVRNGMGDFVPGMTNGFLATLGPAGMGHVGCGSDCGCGPCRSQNGMGTVDLSLTGSGIITSVEGMLSQTGWPAVPNWVFYMAGVAIVFAVYESGKGGRRRR